jgi:hypothetical protein
VGDLAQCAVVAAAVPTAWPIRLVVAMVRVLDIAEWVVEIFRPAMSRLGTLFE